MSKLPNKEEMHIGERFMAFIRSNERVFWVLLLAFLGFTFAFGVPVSQMISKIGSPSLSVGFDEEMTEQEYTVGRRALARTLDRVDFLFQNTFSYGGRDLNLGPKYRTIYPDYPESPRPLSFQEFLLYRRAAEIEGLSVSEAEFEAVRKEAWQRAFAYQVVSSPEHLRKKGIELPKQNSSQLDQRTFQQRWQVELTRLKDGLKKKDVFDEARYQDWLDARGDNPRAPRPDVIPTFTRNIASCGEAFRDGKERYLAFEFDKAIRQFKIAKAGATREGRSIISIWLRLSEGDSRRVVTRKKFEQTLRDLLLIARLDDHINASVQVTGAEAYEEFKRDSHKRKFEWVKLVAPEELSLKVKKSLTPEGLQAHFDENKTAYNSATRLGFKYLAVSMDAFLKEIEAEVKQEDLLKAFEDKKELYVRPGIRQDAGIFQLLSSDAMRERQKQLYLPYEEVKDQVRERYVRETASRKVTEFADQLRARLYPIKPVLQKDDKPAPAAASFEELAAEYKFIKLGKTPYATQADAEDVFGKELKGIYDEKTASRGAIDSWYRAANEEGRKANGYRLTEVEKNSLKNPKYRYEEFIPVSFVYFSEVDIKAPGELTYEEAVEKVTSDLHKIELVKRLKKACEEKIEAIGKSAGGLKALGGSETEIDTFKCSFGKLENSGPDFIAKRDSILLPGEKVKEEAGQDAAKKEPHPSSTVLVSAGFSVEEVNGLKVVEDEEQSACFILNYTAREEPDSAEFEKRRPSLVGRLKDRGEKQVFMQWRKELHKGSGIPIEEPLAPGA